MLNKRRALDQHERKVESLRSRLFACWATWASKQEGPRPLRTQKTAVDSPTDSALADLKTAIGDLRKNKLAVKDCKKNVHDALKTEQTGLQLAGSTRPPFLHPKDPFVVLKADNLVGVDRVRALRPAKDAKRPQPPLDCRLASDVVTGVEQSGGVAKVAGGDRIAVGKKTLGAVWRLPAGHGALALETPALRSELPDLIDHRRLETLHALQTSLEQVADGGRNRKHTDLGRPASGSALGVTRWGGRNPWLPVYLSWQASWSAAYSAGQGADGHSGPLAGWQIRSGPAEGVRDLAGDLVPKAGPAQLEDRTPRSRAPRSSRLFPALRWPKIWATSRR